MEICPFVHGRALRPPEFRGRSGELRRLLGRLATGQSTALIGQPHIGKTSFLNYLSDREARQAIIGDKLDQSIFAYIDSQMLGSSFNQAAFWKQVLSPLTSQFTTGAIYDVYKLAENNQFGAFTLEQLFSVFGKEGWQFVLLIDEFDALLTHAVLNSAEFYGGLRSLTSRCAGFTLVIASRRSLALLNQDTQKINPHGSPYFNVFTELQLGPLPKGHALEILHQAEASFDRHDLEFLFRVSGRQPYLLQLAAAILWELNTQGRQDAERYRDAAEELARQTRAHFTDAWNAWSNAEKKAVTTIALAQIPHLVEQHEFAAQHVSADLTDYSAELRRLKEAGTISEAGEQHWEIMQQAFLWWLADEIKRVTRDDAGFEQWLCAHEIEVLFTKEECAKLKTAAQKVGGLLGKGATTLIETFAKGLGEAL